ncbi:hypothetical protein [Clostridium estertheticum]|nr:hypothetical protein [Clostridium estertheticum]
MKRSLGMISFKGRKEDRVKEGIELKKIVLEHDRVVDLREE